VVCLGNICINTLHKGAKDDDDDNDDDDDDADDDDDDNNNNSNNIQCVFWELGTAATNTFNSKARHTCTFQLQVSIRSTVH
jgi:hypothetical protein